MDFISNQNNTSSLLLTKLEYANTEKLNTLLQQGYSRVLSDDKIEKINNLIEKNQKVDSKNTYLIVDRIIYVDRDEDLINRITDSVETAFFEGNGECDVMTANKKYHFSNKFELDGISFEKNSVHLFAFNLTNV